MYRFFQPLRSSRVRPFKGFTLIELLVVSGVILLISVLLLLRQSSFNSSTILRSVAYSIALSVHQTQVYGTSVVGGVNAGALQYAQGYGLYFSNTSTSSYVLFADFNNNGAFDTNETVEVFSITPGYRLTEACAKLSSGVNRCTGSHDTTGLPTTTHVTILFKRPNPDAYFRTTITGENYTSAWIEVRSADNTARSILVTTAGQVSVQALGTLP